MQQIKEKTIKSYSCYHCGETCSDQLIRLDGKSFCCSSCSSIYKLLSDAQMDNYYRLNTAAGNKLSHEINDDQFEYLYNTEVLDDILRYKDQNRHTVLINLPAIHCSSCVWLLERLYKLVPGVISNDVDFQRKELLLSYNPNETNLATIVHFLHRIGYPVSFNKAIDRDDFSLFELYLKVAIAGFAFGNAMFLYLPDYLDSEFAGSEFKQFFIYFSLMLSLPVLLYCSSDYFKSAWASLKQKHISIDLPISIGIIALFLRSSLDIVLYDEMGYLDSFNGFIFFLLIGKLFQIKSFDHIRFKRNHQ
ncbi:MAG: heavy metal translocating P-type ATPase metal-binding domain-containing protein, partial [Calditrichaeota bacterium]|nr:heavy metal translocating P-type ATPase metal-binding domain-containing protein [Calditrichota bacterium]